MNPSYNDLHEEQKKLEQEMACVGYDLYNSRNNTNREKGREHRNGYGTKLLNRTLNQVADGIISFVEESAGKAGRCHIALKFLKVLDPSVTALITCSCVLENISRQRTLQATALNISKRIETHARLEKFKEEIEPVYNKVVESIKEATTHHVKKNIATHAMNRYGIEWQAWTKTEKIHLGMKLLDIFRAHTGIVDITPATHHVVGGSRKVRNSSKEPMYVITPTEEVNRWIEEFQEQHACHSAEYLPCVVPPKDWTSPFNGGYHYPEIVGQINLVKTRNKEYLEELCNMQEQMQPVYDAINAIQHTAYKVNKRVLTVFDHVLKTGGGCAGIPHMDDMEAPAKPALNFDNKDHWTKEEQSAWKKWKGCVRDTHGANIKARTKRLQALQTSLIANQFQCYDRFFYVWQMDFRGRIYPVAGKTISPQGVEYSKALLTFADGKPIENAEQALWLAIHGANVWGEDKCSFEDRQQWCITNEEMIKSIAASPLDDTRWCDADKPFMFLAWCFEWAEFLEQGFGYVSHLPVAMDGSCNGLQIFSLMLRDEVGGTATNLVPQQIPADIYQVVADKVIKVLEHLKIQGKPVYEKPKGKRPKGKTGRTPTKPRLLWNEKRMAHQWLDLGLTRKATKRQVMTLPYGSTLFSCREYTEEYVRDKVEEGAVCPWEEKEIFTATRFLAPIIWQAMSETVVAAREAMDWIQEVARIAASAGLPIFWTAPSGFPVLQAYRVQQGTRVKTAFGDSAVRVTTCEDTKELDGRRQANGIAPNFVHSLDAAALMLTVNKAVSQGINAFSMVHDSYATHAADAPSLASTLRDVFVTIFTEQDVIQNFVTEVKGLLPEEKHAELPVPPTQGTLDISCVRASRYFFA